MTNLVFHRVSEKKPKHGQEIWYIHNSNFYGTHEFKYETVEYIWEEVDEDGIWTGTSIGYLEGEETPSNCVLSLCGLDDDTLWCSVEDVWEILKT